MHLERQQQQRSSQQQQQQLPSPSSSTSQDAVIQSLLQKILFDTNDPSVMLPSTSHSNRSSTTISVRQYYQCHVDTANAILHVLSTTSSTSVSSAATTTTTTVTSKMNTTTTSSTNHHHHPTQTMTKNNNSDVSSSSSSSSKYSQFVAQVRSVSPATTATVTASSSKSWEMDSDPSRCGSRSFDHNHHTYHPQHHSPSQARHPYIPLLQDALQRAHIAVIILAAFVDTAPNDGVCVRKDDHRNDDDCDDFYHHHHCSNNNNNNNNTHHANYQQAVWILRQCFQTLLSNVVVDPCIHTMSLLEQPPPQQPVHDREVIPTTTTTSMITSNDDDDNSHPHAHSKHHHHPSPPQEDLLSHRPELSDETNVEHHFDTPVLHNKSNNNNSGRHCDDECLRNDNRVGPNHDHDTSPHTIITTWFQCHILPQPQQQHSPRWYACLPWHYRYHITITIPNWLVVSIMGMVSQWMVESTLLLWSSRPTVLSSSSTHDVYSPPNYSPYHTNGRSTWSVTRQYHNLYHSCRGILHPTVTNALYASKVILWESTVSLLITSWMILGTNVVSHHIGTNQH